MRRSAARDILAAVSEVIWPRTCHVCGAVLPSHTDYICSACMAELPRLGFCAEDAHGAPVSLTAERLAACGRDVRAFSWMDYTRHSPYAGLLHDIKYRGCSRLARHLGRTMALDLLPTGFFNGVDVLVPVPLHFMHRIRRGYNQSEMLARGVADILDVPVINPLRARKHRSQTRLSDTRRLDNVKGVYRPDKGHPLFAPGLTAWNHVLLIDDVCTTGATLCEVAGALTSGRANLRISVLTLALTRKSGG